MTFFIGLGIVSVIVGLIIGVTTFWLNKATQVQKQCKQGAKLLQRTIVIRKVRYPH